MTCVSHIPPSDSLHLSAWSFHIFCMFYMYFEMTWEFNTARRACLLLCCLKSYVQETNTYHEPNSQNDNCSVVERRRSSRMTFSLFPVFLFFSMLFLFFSFFTHLSFSLFLSPFCLVFYHSLLSPVLTLIPPPHHYHYFHLHDSIMSSIIVYQVYFISSLSSTLSISFFHSGTD